MANGYGVSPAALLDFLTNTMFASPVYKGYGAQITEDRYELAVFKLPAWPQRPAPRLGRRRGRQCADAARQPRSRQSPRCHSRWRW